MNAIKQFMVHDLDSSPGSHLPCHSKLQFPGPFSNR